MLIKNKKWLLTERFKLCVQIDKIAQCDSRHYLTPVVVLVDDPTTMRLSFCTHPLGAFLTCLQVLRIFLDIFETLYI